MSIRPSVRVSRHVATPIAVLIPTYNRMSHLAECVASVLADDVDGLTVVISDNASAVRRRGDDEQRTYLDDVWRCLAAGAVIPARSTGSAPPATMPCAAPMRRSST